MIAESKKKIVLSLAALVLCAALIVAVGAFGFGLASANDDPSKAETLGFYNTTSTTSPVAQLDAPSRAVQTDGAQSDGDQSDYDKNGMNINANTQSVYTTSTGFNISTAANQVDARIAEERRLAAEAAAAAEREAILRATSNKSGWESTDTASQLEGIDWNIGEAAFVDTWGERINAYLSGTNLAGYGTVFAQAAWDNGIDPRWSPAISHTESSNGAHCFLPYNAWGWGQSSWGNWEDAIKAHVAGLASRYGYSLTYAAAATYCPPNTDSWYSNTLSQMQRI